MTPIFTHTGRGVKTGLESLGNTKSTILDIQLSHNAKGFSPCLRFTHKNSTTEMGQQLERQHAQVKLAEHHHLRKRTAARCAKR
jgi:hypothetical protein